jgi:glycosyltransferase involved in cell wall biosynthesis
VIPCFNQGQFLRFAIESVRRQQWPVTECIVVDDGSTDDTAAVARRLGVALIQQENLGLSAARNTGLFAVRGEFVIFLDADDELLPEAAAHGVEALSANPRIAAAVGRCRRMDADGAPLPTTYSPVDPANMYAEWLSNNFVWTPGAAMFRRVSLLESGGFPTGVGSAGDYAVYLRLSRAGQVLYHGQDIVRYRLHEGSMSQDIVLMLRSTLAVLRRERAHVPRPLRGALLRGESAWREWYGDQIIERLRTDWRSGRRGSSQIRALATLVRHCPGLLLRHAVRRARRMGVAVTQRDSERPPGGAVSRGRILP